MCGVTQLRRVQADQLRERHEAAVRIGDGPLVRVHNAQALRRARELTRREPELRARGARRRLVGDEVLLADEGPAGAKPRGGRRKVLLQLAA